jgi:hypothetical protein
MTGVAVTGDQCSDLQKHLPSCSTSTAWDGLTGRYMVQVLGN